MPGVLDGKAAIVTGGARGIGAAICRRLAADGAAVVVNYARSADAAQAVVAEIGKVGGRAWAVKGDVSDPAGVTELFHKADEHLGRHVDILVNNAGVFEVGPIGEATLESYERQMNVNVRAVFLCSTEAFKRMGPGGRIVNIGSCIGDRAGMTGAAIYAATKSAVQGLTRGFARDLGAKEITVNCVQPGPIATDMNPDSGDFADLIRATTAVGRYGQVDDIAALVAFVVSPAAGNITGACLTSDGGVNA